MQPLANVFLYHILVFFLQLDNADEQAAQVRRELDRRLQLTEQMSRVLMYCKNIAVFVDYTII